MADTLEHVLFLMTQNDVLERDAPLVHRVAQAEVGSYNERWRICVQ